MYYTDILSLICSTDEKSSIDFKDLCEDAPVDAFVPENEIKINDFIVKSFDDKFLIFTKENFDILLFYYKNGTTKNIKSCTTKIALDFDCNNILIRKDKITQDELRDLYYKNFIMSADIYEVSRDEINFNITKEKLKYSVDYFLRKEKDDNFYLEAEITPNNTHVKNIDNQLSRIVLLNKVNDKYQNKLHALEKTSTDNLGL